MSRKREQITSEFYNSAELRSIPASYYLNMGIRSNGKSYDAKDIVSQGVRIGKKFAYIRRLHKHIVRSKMETLFSDYNANNITRNGFGLAYSQSLKGFFSVDEFGDIINEENGVVGKTYCLEDVMVDKGESFMPDIIWFDEFVDLTYFSDEIRRFLNVMSTLIRNRKSGVTVIMSANTISKNCPYFKLFGIPIDKMRKGDIVTIRHENGVVVRCEYCKKFVTKEVLENDGNDYYFGFDDTNETMMITSGDWEVADINIKEFDGYTWASKRTSIPIYISNRKLYEISIALSSSPVAYIREINNTDGIIRPNIKYILSFDNRKFIYRDGKYPCRLLPKSRTVSLFDERTQLLFNKFLDCVECGRFISTDALTGTEFLNTMRNYNLIR